MSNLTSLDHIALNFGKLIINLTSWLKFSQGTNLPGKLSLKISPHLFKNLANDQRIIAVSGTNGKSTTSGLIYNCLQANNLNVVHNRQGANLITGLTTTLIRASSYNGKLNCDYLLLEIDEATLPNVSNLSDIKYLVVTNLFRDQLDRFGELDTTKKLIEKAIINSRITLILNADDPNVSQLKDLNNPKIYFGLDSDNIKSTSSTNTACELAYCNLCQGEISYHSKFYNQLGNWYCSKCDNKRPKPNVLISQLSQVSDKTSVTVKINDANEYNFTYNLPGLFNAYNIASALALSLGLNLNIKDCLSGISKYKSIFGRSETIKLGDQNIVIQLIKNPAGASLALASIDPDEVLIIAINDNLADGKDISWLWDAQFELLAGHKQKIIVSGIRLYDMAVRLKYTNISTSAIICEPDLTSAVKLGLKLANAKTSLRILPTYTCLLELQNIFKKLGYTMSGLN